MVGITNIIPVFGPSSAQSCLLILVFVNPFDALKFLILIIAIQQVDGNIIGPKILGKSIGVSALWVLVAIVIGGDLLGLWAWSSACLLLPHAMACYASLPPGAWSAAALMPKETRGQSRQNPCSR